MLKFSKNKLFHLIILILVFAIIYSLGKLIPEETLRDTINSAGIFAPIVFILISLITNIVAPLSGTPVIFVGYYAFGNNVIFLTTIAAYVSFIINFWVARIWGRPLVTKFVGIEAIYKIDSLAKNYGLVSLFFLRVFQGGIHDFVSYAAGLTNMKFSPYLITSLAASIPGTALWYFLSLQVTTPLAFSLLSLLLTFVFSAIFILGNIIWRKRKKD